MVTHHAEVEVDVPARRGVLQCSTNVRGGGGRCTSVSSSPASVPMLAYSTPSVHVHATSYATDAFDCLKVILILVGKIEL